MIILICFMYYKYLNKLKEIKYNVLFNEQLVLNIFNDGNDILYKVL